MVFGGMSVYLSNVQGKVPSLLLVDWYFEQHALGVVPDSDCVRESGVELCEWRGYLVFLPEADKGRF